MSAELSVHNNILMHESHIVIPPTLRQDMLEKLHGRHQGVIKCCLRARQSVWA